MHLKKGKRLRSIFSLFLTAGAVLSMSFLAFAGVYSVPFLASVALPLGIVAFFLSGFVETKVFGKSISKGLARLKLVANKAEKYLLAIELNSYLDRYLEVLENKGQAIDNTNACGFLNDYYKQRENYRNTRSEEDKKRLDELREFFLTQAIRKAGVASDDGYIDACLAKDAQSMLVVAKRGVWFLRFFLAISAVIGVGSAIVTAYAMNSALIVLLAKIGLVLSTATLLATVWPVAIIAGIGATFLFYYSITDIIKHDVIEKSLKNLRPLFKRETIGEQKERLPSYIFRLVVLTLLVIGIAALTVFATVATAGTWWFSIKSSADLLPRIPIILNFVSRIIIIPINAATDIIYGLSTSLQTIVKLKGLLTPIRYIRQRYTQIEADLSNLKGKETWGQFFNPFRIVTNLVIFPFEWLIFWGHVISVGVTTDRLGDLDPGWVAAGCTIPEALQDANFLIEEKKEKKSELNGQLEAEGVTATKSDDHDHDHGSFLTTILKVILSPLILLSAVWHWGFRKKDDKDGRALSFRDSLKQSFGIHEHADAEASSQQPLELSPAWKEIHRPILFLKGAEERLGSVTFDRSNAQAKQAYITSLLSEREKIVSFVKEKTATGQTTENAIEDYLKRPKEEKTETNGHVPNGINGHVTICSERSEKIEPNTSIKKTTPFDVLNKPRSLAQNCCFFREKPTTTVILINEAFRLAAGG